VMTAMWAAMPSYNLEPLSVVVAKSIPNVWCPDIFLTIPWSGQNLQFSKLLPGRLNKFTRENRSR